MIPYSEFSSSRRFVKTPFGKIAYVEMGNGKPALFLHLGSLALHNIIMLCQDKSKFPVRRISLRAASERADAKADKSMRTKARVIEAARAIFARDGYSKAALSEIIERAGVTTGAVYYHFTDKKGLFLAVAETLEQEILDEVTMGINGADTDWNVFEATVLETVSICARKDIQKIVFREAPAVFGLHEWREIEVKYAFGLMQATVQNLANKGLIKTDTPSMTAQILLGAIIEAAHTVAEAVDKQKAIKAAKSTLRLMLRGLRMER